MCKSASPPPADRGKKKFNYRASHRRQTGGTKWLDTEVEDNDSALPLFVLQGDIPQPPILVNMFLQGSPVEFELDTGAAVTVMSEKKFLQLFPNHSLEHSSIDLKTYTREAMEIVGETTIRVSYADQEPKMLSLVVVAACCPSLLGRNWLQHFVLDWRSVKAGEVLGTITPFKAQLIVTPNAVPRFHRPRQVPYALKSQVEQELNRLEREGVLKRVNHSQWAAPIVTMPKKDGTVRICGDYKVTVNPVLDVDQYPLPWPEDLFATLAGGKFFSTLDLTHAYNQVVLDDDALKYLTISTHRGLYQYTRLPFGVASAPSVFQKMMDTILQGMDWVICYLDDILVSGRTEEEHLINLRKVLERLQEHGIRAKRAKCTFLKTSVQYLGHVIGADSCYGRWFRVTYRLRIQNAPTRP